MPVPTRHSFLALLFLASTASAESEETITVFDDRVGIDDLIGDAEASKDRSEGLSAPPFVTRVRVEERALETKTVAQVLSRTVGVRVRSVGGLAGFSSLSVRGAPPGHTAVWVDGVPLSTVASVTADIGRFALDGFRELALYRGGVPSALGGASASGALALESAVGRGAGRGPFKFTAGVGSFGTHHGQGRWLHSNDGQTFHTRAFVRYAASDGDYPFFNDNGTNLNPADDRIERRTNNGYREASGDGRLRWTNDVRDVEVGTRLIWRAQGVPGSASVQSVSSDLQTATAIIDARTRRHSAGISASLYSLLEWQRYKDLLGEVGLGAKDRRYVTVAGGGQVGFARKWGRHRFNASTEGRGDYFRETDFTAEMASPRTYGARVAGALSTSLESEWGPFRLAPALRLDALRTVPIADVAGAVTGSRSLASRTEWFLSPRFAARWRASSAVAVKANVGRYFRSPTVLELFGDRGYIVGNPSLMAEDGLSLDAGVVLAPGRAHGPLDRMYFELGGFLSRTRDTIAILPTSGLVGHPQNIGDSRTLGAEVVASLRFGKTVTMSGNYTVQDARKTARLRDFSTEPVPRRPVHEFYWRTDVAGRAWQRLWVFWTDVHIVGASALDELNLRRVPARQLLGAGAKLTVVSGFRLGVEGKNLGDQQVAQERLSPAPRMGLERVPRAVGDFGGYPLPGRAFYLTLEWEP